MLALIDWGMTWHVHIEEAIDLRVLEAQVGREVLLSDRTPREAVVLIFIFELVREGSLPQVVARILVSPVKPGAVMITHIGVLVVSRSIELFGRHSSSHVLVDQLGLAEVEELLRVGLVVGARALLLVVQRFERQVAPQGHKFGFIAGL
jgi:hypothetical protein